MMIVTVFFIVANLSGDIPSDRGLWIFGILAFKLGLDGAFRSRSVASQAPDTANSAPKVVLNN
jgi:hypothetical protein